MQLDEDKYVVFKRHELVTECTTWARGGELFKDLIGLRLPDAVVIRRQDYFAAPALDSYACAMQVAARLLPDGEEKERLTSIADYFHEQAQLASVEGMKVPD